MCTPKGRSMVNPGRRNAVTTPGVNGIALTCTLKGRSGVGIGIPIRMPLSVFPL